MKFNALNKNTSSQMKNEDVQLTEAKLYDAELYIKDAIKTSFDQLSNNPSCEDKLVSSWANYLQNLSDYFFQISEESNNKNIYKKVVKHLMFKR